MPDINEVIKASGDVVWDEFRLVNFAGKSINLLKMCSEINIFEDIFSNAVYGNAAVVDTHNLLNTFPIIGQENLFVKFHTPKMGDTFSIEFVFRVYKVSDRVVQGNKSVYMIHFTSYDAFVDTRYTENAPLKGTGDQVIKLAMDRMRNWSQAPNDVKAKLKPVTGFTPSSNTLKIIPPQWSSYQCISYAVRNSLGAGGAADFLFYETLYGHKFARLEDLFKQPVSDTLVYDQVPPSDMIQKYAKINELSYVTVKDNLTHSINHGYGHTVFSHNILNKTVTSRQYKKADLNKFSINGNAAFASNDSQLTYADDHNSMVANVYPYRHNDLTNDSVGEVMLSRFPLLNKLEVFKLDLEIWGRTWLKVGDVIVVNVGKYTSALGDDKDPIDPYSSGKYLITALHHRLSLSQHKMSLQCVKDSNLKEIKSI